MINFFHKLFNPHCEHCRELEREDKRNVLIEHLELEIAQLRSERDRLLEIILEKPEPVVQEVPKVEEETLRVINNKNKRFHNIRQELEQASRIEARELKMMAKSVEEMEKEMKVTGTNTGTGE